MKHYTGSILKAALLAAMAAPTLMPLVHGQQEVDPTWYDPWASTKPAAHATAAKTDAKAPEHRDQKTLKRAKATPEQPKHKKPHRAPESTRTAEATDTPRAN